MRAVCTFLLAIAALSCKSKDPAPANSGDGGATGVAPARTAPAIGAPIAPELIAATVNPGKLPPYTGPTGAIEGRVTVAGDPAPATGHSFAKCPEAEKVYGKAFREGPA